jgi:hypothetical protein
MRKGVKKLSEDHFNLYNLHPFGMHYCVPLISNIILLVITITIKIQKLLVRMIEKVEPERKSENTVGKRFVVIDVK